ncbi:hypothetical protein BDC45DRAFT_526541 [Circinella umbellata]|nr:hypothetical protein BDC45DRAFT_526541 [Circinella umbellata]
MDTLPQLGQIRDLLRFIINLISFYTTVYNIFFLLFTFYMLCSSDRSSIKWDNQC